MKYQPGFVPVQFNRVGKIMVILGLAGIVIAVINYLAHWGSATNVILLVSIGFILIGFYLAKVPPKDDLD